jgi:Holliday junction resolvase
MVRAVAKPDFDDSGNGGIGGKKGGSGPKRSGTYFERKVADELTEEGISKAKRIIGSGAFGTITRDNRLLGDVTIDYDILSKAILAECKFGYARGEKQLTVKKEWIDKIIMEAALAKKYPVLIVKFKGARGKGSKLVVFPWETWKEIMEELTEKVKG